MLEIYAVSIVLESLRIAVCYRPQGLHRAAPLGRPAGWTPYLLTLGDGFPATVPAPRYVCPPADKLIVVRTNFGES